jgi:hypothetical protein
MKKGSAERSGFHDRRSGGKFRNARHIADGRRFDEAPRTGAAAARPPQAVATPIAIRAGRRCPIAAKA